MADIFPGARVVEAGAGSGALSCWLLRAVGDRTACWSPTSAGPTSPRSPGERGALLRRPAPGWRAAGRCVDRASRAPRSDDPPATTRTVDRVVLDMLAPWEYVAAAAAALVPGGLILLLRGHHHPAVPHRGGPARARRFDEPAAWETLIAAGTSRAWRSGPTTGWSATPASWSPPAGSPTEWTAARCGGGRPAKGAYGA